MEIDKGDETVIIKAEPGWYVAAAYWLAEGLAAVSLESILAWLMVKSVGEYHPLMTHLADKRHVSVDVCAITGHGVEELQENEAFKDPLGHFIQPFNATWDTEAGFLAGVKDKMEPLS